jgi:hypothetical protein
MGDVKGKGPARAMLRGARARPGTTCRLLAVACLLLLPDCRRTGSAAAARDADAGPPPSAGEAGTTAAEDAGPSPAADAHPEPKATAAPAGTDDVPQAGLFAGDLVPEWVAADATRTYLPDDLHLLVDGGDEVYERYGVAWALRRTYRTARPTNSRVRIELFAFRTRDGASGRYHHESREAGAAEIEPPTPEALAGKVDGARLDMDQLRLADGRFMALLRYEDDAVTDVARLVADAQEPLLAFAEALVRRLREGTGKETTDEHR